MTMERMEAAYWLALTFALERERRRDRNGLVLTAHRKLGLEILDLVQIDLVSLPEVLEPYRATLERLQAADSSVSGLAFLVDELVDRGIELVPITSPKYPAHVARTLKPEAAPTLLSVAGDVRLLEHAGACVSGSRKSGGDGMAFAFACGAALARAGVTVVTGLAAGPDREALAGAMDAGGRAIGVAPEGILATRAARDAAVGTGRLTVVSEFHPKQRWQAGLAMARNRTLAGLSRMLIVADCVEEGGTTNQVKVHTQIGMPVFVRRGPGEGAFVESLVGWKGVSALPWTRGAVTLPPDLSLESRGEAADIDRSLLASRRRELEELNHLIALRKAELANLEEALRNRPVHRGSTLPEAELVREPEPQPYAAVAPVVDADALILGALHGAPEGLTASELAAATGLSETKARKLSNALVDTHRVEVTKVGRSTRYRAPRTLPLFAAPRESL
jgi:hypothetical protein